MCLCVLGGRISRAQFITELFSVFETSLAAIWYSHTTDKHLLNCFCGTTNLDLPPLSELEYAFICVLIYTNERGNSKHTEKNMGILWHEQGKP